MGTNEQINFVRKTASAIAESIVADILAGKIPETWDGIELRQLLAERAPWHVKMKPTRLSAYRNHILVENL